MGIKSVVLATGKGSWFGFGRIFGVHNPFSSDISKALDPFINLKTLARLSYMREEGGMVQDNLANRMGQPLSAKDFMLISSIFNKRVVIKAFEIVREIDKHNEHFVKDYMQILDPTELDQLARNAVNGSMLINIASSIKTPTDTLIYLLKNNISISNSVYVTIGWTTEEIKVHHDGTFYLCTHSGKNSGAIIEDGGRDETVLKDVPITAIRITTKYPIRKEAADNLRKRMSALGPEAKANVEKLLAETIFEETKNA